MPWEPLPGRSSDEPSSLADAVALVMNHLGAPPPDALGSVVGHWADLVGPVLAERSAPVQVRDGTLLVTVSDPAWATQIRFSATDIIERLHALVGPVATRLDVRVRRA